MSQLAFFVGAILVSILGTYLVRCDAERLGLVQEPNKRSSHLSAVPHGGGLGIVLSFLVFISGVAFLYEMPSEEYLLLLSGGVAIAAVSLWDDLQPIPSPVRLVVHLAVAAPAVSLGFDDTFEPGLTGANFLFYGVTVLALTWWINLFNFMDGIDSLAGLQGLSMALGFLVLSWVSPSPEFAVQSWYLSSLSILLGGIIGFTVFNWPPATIFMGDVGSAFLGFVVGAFALLGWSMEIAPIWSWLILTGVFFVDATYTLLRRVFAGEKWWQAHNSHAYQCISRYLAKGRENGQAGRTFAHRMVAVGAALINLLWLLPFAVFAQYYPDWGLLCLTAAWLPLSIVVVQWSRSDFSTD